MYWCCSLVTVPARVEFDGGDLHNLARKVVSKGIERSSLEMAFLVFELRVLTIPEATSAPFVGACVVDVCRAELFSN